jgi:hypothetical protein
MNTRQTLGYVAVFFGLLELGFVGLVGGVLGRGAFLAWSGSSCVVLVLLGLATLGTPEPGTRVPSARPRPGSGTSRKVKR